MYAEWSKQLNDQNNRATIHTFGHLHLLCTSFLGLNYNVPPLGALKSKNGLSHHSRGRKSEIKVSMELVSSDAVFKNPFHASLLAPGGLLGLVSVC